MEILDERKNNVKLKGVKLTALLFFPPQKVRFANLSKFKASVYKILIATDVASR